MLDHLNAAIEKAGGIFAFCRMFGLTHQAVYNWKRRGWVPFERAVEIEAHLGTAALHLVKPSVREALTTVSAGTVL